MSVFNKEILFNDGEGIDVDDFNNLQHQARALLMNMILGSLARVAETDVTPSATKLFAVAAGGAPYAKGVTRQVANKAGFILQHGGAFNLGDDANLFGYWAELDEFLFTLAVGDATNPRIDLVQVKLEGAFEDNSIERDFEDAAVIGNGDAIEETLAVVANVGTLPQRALSILAITATVGTSLGPKAEQSSSVAPVAGSVQIDVDRQTLTFFAGDGVTQAKVTYIPAINVAHVKTSDFRNKRRRIKATVSVKQGTPAATPVEPTPDAAFVKWYAVNVPATFNTTFDDKVHLLDYRNPIPRYRDVLVPGKHALFDPTSFNDLADGSIQATGTVTADFVVPGDVLRSGRLLKIEVQGDYATAGVSLQRRDFSTMTTTQVKNIGSAVAPGIIDLSAEAWWCNGYQNGVAVTDTDTVLMVRVGTTNTKKIYGVRFEVLG